MKANQVERQAYPLRKGEYCRVRREGSKPGNCRETQPTNEVRTRHDEQLIFCSSQNPEHEAANEEHRNEGSQHFGQRCHATPIFRYLILRSKFSNWHALLESCVPGSKIIPMLALHLLDPHGIELFKNNNIRQR